MATSAYRVIADSDYANRHRLSIGATRYVRSTVEKSDCACVLEPHELPLLSRVLHSGGPVSTSQRRRSCEDLSPY